MSSTETDTSTSCGLVPNWFHLVVDPAWAAFLIGQPDPNFQAKASAGTDGARSPVGPGLSQLAQGGIKPEPQLDHLQDTP
jgi:hypothetical protein